MITFIGLSFLPSCIHYREEELTKLKFCAEFTEYMYIYLLILNVFIHIQKCMFT